MSGKQMALIGVLVYIAAELWIGILLPPRAVATAKLAPLGERPECPRHEGFVTDSAGTLVVRQEIAASGTITLIPEFHDCQKLLADASKGSFGPLVAIFARFDAGSVGDPATSITINCPPIQLNSSSNPLVSFRLGQNVQIQGVTCGIPIVTAPRLDGTEQATVTVLNYDEPYAPLGLQHGISCIYVYHSGPTWAAQMFAAPAADETGVTCTKPMSEQTGGISMSLRVVDEGGPPPPVTRWDWNGSKHLIGVACGSKWCELAKDELGDETPFLTDLDGKRIRKGTYDQQFLAVPGPSSELVPGPADGTILPVPWLTGGDPALGAWTTVANGALTLEVSKYDKRFKMKNRTAGQGTELALCRGSKSDCLPPQWRIPWRVNKCDQTAPDGTQDPWWARLSLDGKETYRCVIRRDHPAGAPVPPDVVRWRWDLKDEGIWRRCSTGCCEVT